MAHRLDEWSVPSPRVLIPVLGIGFLVALMVGSALERLESGDPARWRSDLETEIKLNCEARIERAARDTIGPVVFANMYDSAVSFDAMRTTFRWESYFTAPETFPSTRRYPFVCSGSGSGSNILNWRIDDIEMP